MNYQNLYELSHEKKEIVQRIKKLRQEKKDKISNFRFKDINQISISHSDILHFYAKLENYHPVIKAICQIYSFSQKGSPKVCLTREQTRIGLNAPINYFSEKEAIFYALNGISHGYLAYKTKIKTIHRLLEISLKTKKYKDLTLLSLGIFFFQKAINNNLRQCDLTDACYCFEKIGQDRVLFSTGIIFQALIFTIQKDYFRALELLDNKLDEASYELKVKIQQKIYSVMPENHNVYYLNYS